jgi:uncharacterized membrane protein
MPARFRFGVHFSIDFLKVALLALLRLGRAILLLLGVCAMIIKILFDALLNHSSLQAHGIVTCALKHLPSLHLHLALS